MAKRKVTISMQIENTYEDGDTITTVGTATVPAPAGEEGSQTRSDWEHEHIFPLTGTGRTDGDAWYNVEVTASSRPDLIAVGTTYEFGY